MSTSKRSKPVYLPTPKPVAPQIYHFLRQFHMTLSLSKILGYIILYCGSLILLSKIFLAIL